MNSRPIPTSTTAADDRVQAELRRLTRRSFATGALAALAGGASWAWVVTRPDDDGLPRPLRRVLELNEALAQRLLFSHEHRAPEFATSQALEPRVNGHVGLATPLTTIDWSVQITGLVDRRIPLSAIRALPAQVMTTEFKCVEGWSRVVSWKGVRLADFLAQFGVESSYVGLSTPPAAVGPDGEPDVYQVGLDRPSATHPQTLLCYEMNGQPLTAQHGAPLRLVSAVKYGYKSIKRIATMHLDHRRPPDYWAQRGYDWYGGL